MFFGGDPGTALAQETAAREYQVKAVFLHHFTRFVDWPPPPDGSIPAAKPFVVGVLGQDPFGSVLDEVTAGETVRDSPIEVRRLDSIENVSECDLLFVSRSEQSHLPDIFAQLAGRPVLTLGDSENFAQRGGMIGFITRNNRVHLQINLTAARAAGFSINSNLLRAATIVEPAAN